MWIQERPFDQSKMGHVKGACLANTRMGYGIPAKYPNAITAWAHTEQHTDRNIPQGVDVPLFYTYGVDGHINVRLADGRVQSDGDYYASLEDYESKKYPKYVGWGTSVNDVTVIGGSVDDYKMNKGDVINGFAIFKRVPSQADLDAWVGQTFKKFQYEKITDGVAKIMADLQAQDLANNIGLAMLYSEEELKTLYDVDYQWKHIQAEPYTYAAGLLKQQMGLDRWKQLSYKASHYDADVAGGNATQLKPGVYRV